MSAIQRLRVTIDGTDHEIAVGAFAQIAAKRRFGLDTCRSGDPEPVLFGVWIELDGPRPKGEDPEEFDRWLQSVEAFKLVEGGTDDEDPPPAESSASLLDSPPTSE